MHRILIPVMGIACSWPDSLRYTGFHYVDFELDGDDLACLVRTAYRGANSFHNSNRITFHRVVNWRQYLHTCDPLILA
jgi:hypothetical protein